MQTTCRKISWFALAALALVIVAGCSEDKRTAHLQGNVTIDGQPIPDDAEAVIMIRPVGEGQSRGKSARLVGSRFDVPDAPRGPVLVQFSIEQPTGEIAPFAPGARREMRYRSLVPEEYTPGVKVEVEGDNLNMEFEL